MSVCDSTRRRLRKANTPFIRPALHTLQFLIPETRPFPYRTTLRSSSQQLSRVKDKSVPQTDVICIEAQTANLHPATADDKCRSDARGLSSITSTDSMNGSTIRTYTHEAMMRNKPASSMQKTYDECYLICSTAVYFEGQNNEAEALRSWRSALDQIYYHNAYKMPAAYVAKSDVEKALQESLRQLELQAKERVDLLEALRDSRKEAGKEEKAETRRRKLEKGKGSVESLTKRPSTDRSSSGWIGGGTVPPAELPRAPNLPARPPIPTNRSSDTLKETRSYSVPMPSSSGLGAPPTLPVPAKQVSRSPSPDAGRKTMRTTLRTEKKGFKSPRSLGNQRRRPEPMKAASLAWDVQPRAGSQASIRPDSDPTIEARLGSIAVRRSLDQGTSSRRNSLRDDMRRDDPIHMPDSSDYIPSSQWRESSDPFNQPPSLLDAQLDNLQLDPVSASEQSNMDDLLGLETPPLPPPHASSLNPVIGKRRAKSPPKLSKPPDISYRREYPKAASDVPPVLATKILDRAYNKTAPPPPAARNSSGIHRKPLANTAAPKDSRPKVARARTNTSSGSESERNVRKVASARASKPKQAPTDRRESAKTVTPPSTDADSHEENTEQMEADERSEFQIRADKLMQNLPKGVDENAAKQVFNEIVVEGDEVHWDDVAGLDAAKKALKEAVVYPFLRPDLFMGLREPARGMLLFGPPGTGKTMLARAVATESKSTFFAISASSLTSKWHGESEKLVRALFALAKALAPSIIFVDEIDSLLSSRSGSSEHEASRRSKTEFLIQWSDLQKAAAGRDTSKEIGDPSRVLVLAATNLPWDIDEAARRRFVRRQYIPLPESETREVQLRTLLGHQKHGLSARDIWRVVGETEGFSGSDITALAKDAAMGPLRNLGEALLYTPMDQIRPICYEDFEASLINIRPSVSKKGLEQFEEWAKEFGERGG